MRKEKNIKKPLRLQGHDKLVGEGEPVSVSPIIFKTAAIV